MIRTVIVDDEVSSSRLLEIKLKDYVDILVVRVFRNSFEFLESMQSLSVDVCFMDIEMPEINGIDLAERLNRLENPPLIVFVTAFSEFSIDAFKVNAIDYLLKPVIKSELDRVIDKLTKLISKNDSSLVEGLSTISNQEIGVRMLGQFTFCQQDQPIHVKFPVAKSIELVCFLLLKLKQRSDKWCIIEALWPNKEMEAGWSSLRTTISRTNQGFKEAGLDIRIRIDKSEYFIDPPLNLIDLSNLENTSVRDICDLLENSNIEEIRKLYPGHLLQDKDYIWLYEKDAYYSSLYFKKMNDALKQCKEIDPTFINSMLPLVFDNIEFLGLFKAQLSETTGLLGLIEFFTRHPSSVDDILDEALQKKIKELLELGSNLII